MNTRSRLAAALRTLFPLTTYHQRSLLPDGTKEPVVINPDVKGRTHVVGQYPAKATS